MRIGSRREAPREGTRAAEAMSDFRDMKADRQVCQHLVCLESPFPNDSRAPARSAHKGPLPPANSFWRWLPRAHSVGLAAFTKGKSFSPFPRAPNPRSRSPRPSPQGKVGQGNSALIRLRHLLPREKGCGRGRTICPSSGYLGVAHLTVCSVPGRSYD
jgi:hypothetical protein